MNDEQSNFLIGSVVSDALDFSDMGERATRLDTTTRDSSGLPRTNTAACTCPGGPPGCS